MTDDTMVNVPNEGQSPFAPETEDDTSADSPAENNEEDETQSPDGDDENSQDDGEDAGDGKDTDPDKDVPFHEHPRWKQREEEWQERFNKQETRHQDDIKAVREEFAAARKENAENTEIPDWFGGTQDQWNSFRQWQDGQINAAEERALKRVSETNNAESQAVKEATDFMRTEISHIEGDKTINPEGKKVDPNKLLKFTMDNDLVDSKGRWNYRAAWRLMQGQPAAAPVKPKTDKKVIAGATASDNRGEAKPKAFKTTDDFKASRPW